MKSLVTLFISVSMLSTVAWAKRGGAPDPTNGKASWILTESAEHELRELLGKRAVNENNVTSVLVKLTSATTSSVEVRTDSNSILDTCSVYDDSSRGGTIIKKDIFCTGGLSVRPTRSTIAWFVLESLEHSMRLLTSIQPSVLDQASQVKSELIANGQSKVTIDSAGTSFEFICQMVQHSDFRADVLCTANN